MYCIDAKVNTYYIYRLMIDTKYQSKGYGFEAMRLLIDRIKSEQTYHRIYIDYRPDNKAAEKLYTKLGFVPAETKRDDDDIIMKYDY